MEKEHVWMGLERQSLTNSCFFHLATSLEIKGMEGNLDLESLEVLIFLKTSSVEFKVDCVEVMSPCTVPEELACHSGVNQGDERKMKQNEVFVLVQS